MDTATTGDAQADDLRFDQRTLQSFRLFSTRPGTPRYRRPTDWILLAICLVTLVFSAWAAEPPGRLSNDVLQFVDDSPEWMLSIWLFFFEAMVVWAVLLSLLTLFRRHFLSFASAVASVVLGILIAFIAQRLVLEEPVSLETFLRTFTASEGPPSFPAIRLLAVSAVISTLSPAVSRPFRFFGRVVMLLGFLGTIGLGAATFAGAVSGLTAGVAAAAIIHLTIGSPGGRPTRTEIKRVLAQLGVPVDDLQPATLEPAGVVLMDGTHADGRAITLKVYGRDAWDGQFITKAWRSLWYKDSRSTLLLSRLHQVEHEALLTMLARRAGTPVPEVLIAGQASGDAALVATSGGTPLAQFATDGGAVADTTVVELWSAMDRAHRAGIVHEALDLNTVTVDEHGGPLIVDWSAASVAAPPDAVDAERAQLLVLSSLVVGDDRALEIAEDAINVEELARTI
ncbi:MAG: hypothetical protein ACR2O6_11565, partial [Ilumatobacteraceae bacterium]